jgi:hypothetical protein
MTESGEVKRCPSCGSDRIRRGGTATWLVYLVLIALAIPAVLVFELNAAIVGGVMIAAIILTHLVLDQRVCLACGHQWPQRDDNRPDPC